MAATDREMTSTTHHDMLETIWADETRNAIEFEQVLASPSLVDTHYEAQLTVGRSLAIPLRANLNAYTKSEGISNTITFQSVPGSTANVNTQTVTVSTYQYSSALINAVVVTQSKYEERQELARQLGYPLMRGIETAISALVSGFTQVVGTYGADPDLAVLQRAWQYLRDIGVSSGANWWFGPAAVASFFGNDKLTSSDFVNGTSAIESAKLPSTIFGYSGVVSNLLTQPAAGQTDCGLIHKEAIILLRQIKPTVRESFLIKNIADAVVAFDLYDTEKAVWVSETPAGDSDPTQIYSGGVLIRSS